MDTVHCPLDSESEYETTDDETDDEDQDRCGYSCPFCLEVFHTRETAQRKLELHHGDETEGEMEEPADDDHEHSCPFCGVDFASQVDAMIIDYGKNNKSRLDNTHCFLPHSNLLLRNLFTPWSSKMELLMLNKFYKTGQCTVASIATESELRN